MTTFRSEGYNRECRALLRNEESGEKRLSFFFGLATAVGAGLAGLAAGTDVSAHVLTVTARISLAVLFLLGIVTYLRMLKRHRVTDRLKDTLDHIRTAYIAQCAAADKTAMANYRVPAADSARVRLPGGGYAQTVATIDGILLAAWLIITNTASHRAAGIIGFALIAVLWLLSSFARPSSS